MWFFKIDFISNLENIQYLKVENPNISNNAIVEISLLTRITFLDLSHAEVTDIAINNLLLLQNLETLKKLDLALPPPKKWKKLDLPLLPPKEFEKLAMRRRQIFFLQKNKYKVSKKRSYKLQKNWNSLKR